MSDSAIPREEYPNITPISRNTHMTGKEKTSAAKLIQDVLAVGWAFSDGECELVGNRHPSQSHSDLSRLDLQPPQLLACVQKAPQL
jgi:hypothetical protein